MDGEQTYFQSALSDLVYDMASGGAIRHLADLGYTVRQIQEKLDFPTPYERIQKTVWRHLTDSGIIVPEGAEPGKTWEKAEYVREYDSYGRASFRRVTVQEEPPGSAARCLLCCFGRVKREEPERYAAALGALDPEQAEYIEGLPWTEENVFYRPDRRMLEIYQRLEKAGLAQGVCFFREEKR